MRWLRQLAPVTRRSIVPVCVPSQVCLGGGGSAAGSATRHSSSMHRCCRPSVTARAAAVLRRRDDAFITQHCSQRRLSGTPSSASSTNYAPEPVPPFCTHTAAQSLRASGLTEAQLDAVIAVIKRAAEGSSSNAQAAISTGKVAHELDVERKLTAHMTETMTLIADLKDELKTLENTDYRELEKEIDDVGSKIDTAMAERDYSRRELTEQIDAKLERLENRILRFAFTLAASGTTLGLAVWRLML
jgi:HPt (histidine-containing phosphotransfer) domain-containing protein